MPCHTHLHASPMHKEHCYFAAVRAHFRAYFCLRMTPQNNIFSMHAHARPRMHRFGFASSRMPSTAASCVQTASSGALRLRPYGRAHSVLFFISPTIFKKRSGVPDRDRTCISWVKTTCDNHFTTGTCVFHVFLGSLRMHLFHRPQATAVTPKLEIEISPPPQGSPIALRAFCNFSVLIFNFYFFE